MNLPVWVLCVSVATLGLMAGVLAQGQKQETVAASSARRTPTPRLQSASACRDTQRLGRTHGRRPYVLVKPLRVFVTLKVPSCCAVTLIRKAGA